jgi:hypothetical protein
VSGEGGRDVGHLEADVVEALAPARQESGNAGGVVGRLHQLQLHVRDRQEGDAHPVGRDRDHRARGQPQRVPVEAERGVQVADDDGQVVDPADPVQMRRDGRDVH